MTAPDNTGEKRAKAAQGKPPKEYQFKPGNSGRPKGARNKLGEDFIKALAEDFEQHGVAAIATVRDTKPDQYLKVIASLMPKEMNLNIGPSIDDLTDDELIERIRDLHTAISPLIDAGIGQPTARTGEATKH